MKKKLLAAIIVFLYGVALCLSEVPTSEIPEHPECSKVEGDFWDEIMVNINPASPYLKEEIEMVSYNLLLEETDPERILFFSRIASGEYSQKELQDHLTGWTETLFW